MIAVEGEGRVSHFAGVRAGRTALEADKRFGIAHGKWLERDHVEEAEGCDVDANTDAED